MAVTCALVAEVGDLNILTEKLFFDNNLSKPLICKKLLFYVVVRDDTKRSRSVERVIIPHPIH